MATPPTLPTIWEVPEDLWQKIRLLLPEEKPLGTPGRPVVAFRRVLNGILYVARTGCQWKKVPRCYGSGSTVHERFQQWQVLGVFKQIWALLLTRYDELAGIGWDWQSLDSASLKAPFGGVNTGKNPTDRGKLGVKRHVLVDRRGAPLAVELSGAERHDMKMALRTLDAILVERPTRQRPQHLCLDKGYDYPEIDRGVAARTYHAHIPRRGETPARTKHPARRWVVERTHSWYNRFRKLLIRFEKKDENYLALIYFASTLIIYRTICRLRPRCIKHGVFG